MQHNTWHSVRRSSKDPLDRSRHGDHLQATRIVARSCGCNHTEPDSIPLVFRSATCAETRHHTSPVPARVRRGRTSGPPRIHMMPCIRSANPSGCSERHLQPYMTVAGTSGHKPNATSDLPATRPAGGECLRFLPVLSGVGSRADSPTTILRSRVQISGPGASGSNS